VIHNRHGLPVLTSLLLLKQSVATFKDRAPYPPVIERKIAITCERLKRMERELAGGAR
jgi:hypothetical protein